MKHKRMFVEDKVYEKNLKICCVENIRKAKEEVFDDIDKELKKLNMCSIHPYYENLKKKHLKS